LAKRTRLLEQLDEEESLITSGQHPLFAEIYARLTSEKAVKLGQLQHLREHHQIQVDQYLESQTETIWRQWTVCTSDLRAVIHIGILTAILHTKG
jgi:hypothetical protein